MSSQNTQARRRLYAGLSCITVDADSRPGELDGLSYFDVPLEDYETGSLTGARLVYELLRQGAVDECFDSFSGVLEEAVAELVAERGQPLTDSKRGAAVGFLETMNQVFNYAASRLDFAPVFKGIFEAHEIGLADDLADMRKTNAVILADLAGYPEKGGAA